MTAASDAMHGVVVLDKPRGRTSAHVVGEVKHRLGADCAGHTGTLDPMATGVLPICLGDATKIAGWLIADDKHYLAELELGVETETLDADGAIVAEDRAGAAAIDEATLRNVLAGLGGASLQVPPMYSAIRQGKRRLHELARAGETVERAPRPIVVHRLELVEYAPPRARLIIECSKGTFVRSLVGDVGATLGCGAHLTALRRIRSGGFAIAQAVALDTLTPEIARTALVRPSDALSLPRVDVPAYLVDAVKAAHKPALGSLLAHAPQVELFQMVTEQGELLALARQEGGKLRFERVFRYGLGA